MYAIASAPSRVASRLGLRGLKRQRALENNPSWKAVEPLIRWLGVRVSGVLTDEQWTAIDAQIALAGDYMGITPEEFVALTIVSIFGGAAFGAVFGALSDLGGITVMLGMVVGAALPYLQVSGEGSDRLKHVNRGLPSSIDLIALGMSAGLDFPNAIRQIIEKSSDPNDALVEEFTLLLQELKLGRTRKQALLEFERRIPVDSVKEFVGAVIQAEERGNPVVETLQIQAEMARMRRSVRAEEQAAKASVQMLGPLMFLLLCVMILVLAPIGITMQNN
jgi:tight adherence protein C